MEFPSTFGVCLLLLLALGAGQSWAASWSYKGDTGPTFWHELFPQACSGKSQSPINIMEEQTLYNPDLRDFAIWYDPPQPGSSMQVLNNGHTVQVVTTGEFHVTNGGLPNVYSTVQFHFHWGDAGHHGSEHTINSHAYPLELHIVNYNSDLYDNIGEAVQMKQGLAVLGVMFEVTDEDNAELEPVIQAMKQVRDPEMQKTVEIEPLSLRRLLPEDISEYFRYNGSLTTPGCFESVIWTLFAQPQHLSKRQMNEFRKQLEVRSSHGKGHHKRSARSAALPGSHRERRRERRALQLLNELGMTQEQQERFRRDLSHKKERAEELAATIDEDGARESHQNILEAVHVEVDHDDDDDDDFDEHDEVQIEYMREAMVNNFRPVQPVNDRLVYRSFKLRGSDTRPHHGSHSKHHHHRTQHHQDRSHLPDDETIRARWKMYPSKDSAASASSVVSMLLLLLSCLTARFL